MAATAKHKFNKAHRDLVLAQSEDQIYDVFIVGGGITGAGVARDAISRGLSVFLAEARDFAIGTSSRSSKLVHGGIRYLENLEFGLVHEALTERKILLETAPHMVHPLRFMIPIYKGSRVGLLKMEMGMILYDVLSLFEAPQLHEMQFKAATSATEPLLRADELVGSVTYSDAFMEDDRLVIETLRSAVEMGVHAASYARVVSLKENENHVVVEVHDDISGSRHRVRARQVVGCTGPWTDLFGKQALSDWKSVLRPTKGIHLVFSRERLPVYQAVVMAVEERIVFVIPRGDVVIVGTTDTDFKDNPSGVNSDVQDVEYLLQVTNRYFPTSHLQTSDVISCYSGVRPLVRDQAGSEGKTSREHQIFHPSPRTTVVAGGKYTTYRAMGEEIVDAVAKKLPETRRMSLRPSKTNTLLNSGASAEKIDRLFTQAERWAEDFQVRSDLVRELARRHGEDALQILSFMKTAEGSTEDERRWSAEAQFSIQNHMCFNLVDFYWRRTPLFLFHEDHGLVYLRALAKTFATHLHWTEAELSTQLKSLQSQIQTDLKSLTNSRPTTKHSAPSAAEAPHDPSPIK